ncbi:MAG: PBS lyase, partial [Patescibacteria group bacterium]|nr:PBS lyase [Patescibacteria group bacterium]
MLEGLDTVDWASLRHAYGEATDVPGLLSALLSPDPKLREEATCELFGNIWHQGTVYPASAAAVPFLYELLTAPD